MVELLDYVKALEGKSNRARGQEVLVVLKELGIEPTVQQCRFLKVKNIVVDLPPGPKAKRLLFSAHYDAVRGSPGANDNASSVAVLLGLCHMVRHGRAPVRAVFFDREEAWLRTPVLRLGLLGSFHYACKNDLRDTVAVYNLEFCGLGDYLGIWPVRDNEKDLPALKAVSEAATSLGVPFKEAHIPWFSITSDHLPFRLRGFSNALTLSILPASQVPVLQRLLAEVGASRVLFRQRPVLPEPLSRIHTPEDTSRGLSEDSLKLMLSLLLELSTKWALYTRSMPE